VVKDRNDAGVCACDAKKELIQFVILGISAAENICRGHKYKEVYILLDSCSPTFFGILVY
jgi:hypothetical protein